MRDDILQKLYANEQYLDYLRHNPKWYYYLDADPNNYKYFERAAKEALNITFNDRIEGFKKQLKFANSIVSYFKNK